MIPGFNTARLSAIAQRTPASRDRYVDFLRAFSIGAVVIGHWITTLVIYEQNGIRIRNAVGVIPGMWLASWIFQVMPLFFFVGGFSNLLTYDSLRRRGQPLSVFFRTRAMRLFRPSFVFIAIWIIIIGIVSLFFHWWERYALGALLIFGPLWFLGVYSFVIFCAPAMLGLHRRFGLYVPITLAVLVVLIDVLSFGFGIPHIRLFNTAFVWLLVHQLGFFYADGSLLRRPRLVPALMAMAGLAGLILLTNFVGYPRSMVGTGFDRISNMSPPTVCIVMLALWQIGLAMLLRDPVNRWLQRRQSWMAVLWANSTIMTIYLWHLTAYAAAYLIFLPTGWTRSAEITAVWWLQRLIWITIPSAILLFLIAIFNRFERVPGSETDSRGGSSRDIEGTFRKEV